MSDSAYTKALKIIFSVSALDEDIIEGKNNKYLARFIRYGHEIPTVPLKTLIKRNVLRFLTEGIANLTITLSYTFPSSYSFT